MIFKIRNFFFTIFWVGISALFVIISVPILGIVLLFRYLKQLLTKNCSRW